MCGFAENAGKRPKPALRQHSVNTATGLDRASKQRGNAVAELTKPANYYGFKPIQIALVGGFRVFDGFRRDVGEFGTNLKQSVFGFWGIASRRPPNVFPAVENFR